jgi:two-component system response regulator
MKKSWSGKRLLLVEDSEMLLRALESFFKKAGCQVHSANNGLQALEILEQFSFDLVMSDIQMPLMGGLELLREIRLRNPRTPIVLLSTGESQVEENEVYGAGGVGLLLKPYTLRKLSEVFDSIFSEQQA